MGQECGEREGLCYGHTPASTRGQIHHGGDTQEPVESPRRCRATHKQTTLTNWLGRKTHKYRNVSRVGTWELPAPQLREHPWARRADAQKRAWASRSGSGRLGDTAPGSESRRRTFGRRQRHRSGEPEPTDHRPYLSELSKIPGQGSEIFFFFL